MRCLCGGSARPHDPSMATGQSAGGGPDPGGETRRGVVYDVDGVLRVAPLYRQWGRLRALITRGPRDRRSLLGMQRVLRLVTDGEPDVPVFYLTALPPRLARPLLAALRPHPDRIRHGRLDRSTTDQRAGAP